MAMIEVVGLTKKYPVGAAEFVALRDVTLAIDHGEFVALVGPSGSGKSTLLNLVAGIDRPTSGRVIVDGVEVGQLNEDGAARWRGRTVGVVFQFFQLLPVLTLAENVMLPMDFCGVHTRADRPWIARRLLDQMSLGRHADKLPSQVSGGEQQRAAIARALANDPPVLVADEPTGNLDSVNASAVMDLFAGLCEQGRTILMVTHDRDLAARANRVIEVRDGQLLTAPSSRLEV